MTTIHENLEDVKAQLLEMLNRCRKAPKPKAASCDRSNIPEGYWMDSRCRLRKKGNFSGGVVDLGSIGVGGAQVAVTPGGGLAKESKNLKDFVPKKKPKNIHPLLWAIQLAVWKCQENTARANKSYYRCLSMAAKTGTSSASCKALYVQVSCPEVKIAQDNWDRYNASKGKNNSGSGGGGGF